MQDEIPKPANHLLDYYKTHHKEFVRLAKLARRTFDPEAIHGLRVIVKRMRALFRFVEKVAPASDANALIGDLRAIFKAAGQVRDAQVQRSLLAGYQEQEGHKFKPLARCLETMEKKGRGRLAKALRKQDPARRAKLHRARKKALADFSADELSREVRFVKSRFSTIWLLMDKMDQPENVHRVRRALKEATYISDLLRQHLPAEKAARLELESAKQLGDKLGQWHDRFVMACLIDALPETASEGKQGRRLRGLRQQLEQEQLQLLQDLRAQLAAEESKLDII